MSEFGNEGCDGIGWSGPSREPRTDIADGSRCGKPADLEWCGRPLCWAHREQVIHDLLYAAYLALHWASRALQNGAADAAQHVYDSLEQDPEFQLLETEANAATDAAAHVNYQLRLRRIERGREGELRKTSDSLGGSGRPAGDGDREP